MHVAIVRSHVQAIFVDSRRRADLPEGAVLPDVFAAFAVKAIHIEVLRAYNDEMPPDCRRRADAGVRRVVPTQSARWQVEGVEIVIVGADVQHAIGNGWCRAYLLLRLVAPADARRLGHDGGWRGATCPGSAPHVRGTEGPNDAGVHRWSQPKRLFQRLFQLKHILIAMLLVLLQTLHDDFFKLRRDGGIESARGPLMEAERRLIARITFGEQMMHHRADGVDVRASLGAALILFRCGIPLSADICLWIGGLEDLGDTEIYEHDAVIGCQNDITGLEVTEYDRLALHVQEVDDIADLNHPVADGRRVEGARRSVEHLLQIESFNVFEDQIGAVELLERVVDTGNVGMAQRFEHQRLTPEVGHVVLQLMEARNHLFHRAQRCHVGVREVLVADDIDVPHASLAEHAFYTIAIL